LMPDDTAMRRYHPDMHREVIALPDASPVGAGTVYTRSEDAIIELYVEHPNFIATLDDVLRRVRRCKRRKGSQRSILVAGHSGVGKSTLIAKVEAEFPRVEDGRRLTLRDGSVAVCDDIPVVCIECPNNPLESTLVVRLLEAIGDPRPKKRNTEEGKTALKGFLKVCGTLAVVVDEAHRPTDRQGTVLQGGIATFFQELHDEGCAVILVGLGRAEALMEGDTQVERRWDDPFRLDGYTWGDLAVAVFGNEGDSRLGSRVDFMTMLKAVLDAVELEWDAEIDVAFEEDAFLFFYASRGLMGYLKKLVHAVVLLAEDAEATVITKPMLAKAFGKVFRRETKGKVLQNPFLPNFVVALPPDPPSDNFKVFPTRRRRKGGRTTKKERKANLTYRVTK